MYGKVVMWRESGIFHSSHIRWEARDWTHEIACNLPVVVCPICSACLPRVLRMMCRVPGVHCSAWFCAGKGREGKGDGKGERQRERDWWQGGDEGED